MGTSRSRHLFHYLLALILSNLVTYTVKAQSVETLANTPLVNQLRNDMDSDQVLARIPISEAPIASVAQARVEIALHQAKQKAGQLSCAGRWIPTGPISVPKQGIDRASAQLVSQDRDYWYYRVSRKPQPFACQNISRAGYFLEMSRHLPAWVVIRPAGQQIAFQEGQAVLHSRTTIVALAR